MNHNPYAVTRHLHYLNDALHTLAPTHKRPGVRLEGPWLGLIAQLDEFVWAVLKESEPPYYFESKRLQRRRRVVPDGQQDTDARKSPWDSLYAAILRIDDVLVPYLCFAPHLELLLEAYRTHPISAVSASASPIARFDRLRCNAEVFNDFCAEVRTQLLSSHLLTSRCHSWGLSATENLKRLHHYVEDYTDRVQITTAYHFWLPHSSDLLDLRLATETVNSASLRALIKCRETFFNGFARNRSLFPEKPGYVWSVEPHIHEGWGLRLTLLWPSKVLAAEGINVQSHAHQLGRYWVAQATKGQGRYWLQRIDQDVIGRFSAKFLDYNRRLAFVRSLEPLALRNALVRILHQPEGKFFGIPQQKRRAPRRMTYFRWTPILPGSRTVRASNGIATPRGIG